MFVFFCEKFLIQYQNYLLNTNIFSSKICSQSFKDEIKISPRKESEKQSLHPIREKITPRDIPDDLQKTIAALKVARPKHAKMKRRQKYPLHHHRFLDDESISNLDVSKESKDVSFHILRKSSDIF